MTEPSEFRDFPDEYGRTPEQIESDLFSVQYNEFNLRINHKASGNIRFIPWSEIAKVIPSDELRLAFGCHDALSFTPEWKPPTWLRKGSWLWSNDGERWIASRYKPKLLQEGSCHVWCPTGAIETIGEGVTAVLLNLQFEPPHWIDAPSSLRQIL